MVDRLWRLHIICGDGRAVTQVPFIYLLVSSWQMIRQNIQDIVSSQSTNTDN
jgi:hypothetical protein